MDEKPFTIKDVRAMQHSMELNDLRDRIAALEAQNARLLALVRKIVADANHRDNSGIKYEVWQLLESYGLSYTRIVESARALLAELEGGARSAE